MISIWVEALDKISIEKTLIAIIHAENVILLVYWSHGPPKLKWKYSQILFCNIGKNNLNYMDQISKSLCHRGNEIHRFKYVETLHKIKAFGELF